MINCKDGGRSFKSSGRLLTAGDIIEVLWGRFGRVRAKVDRITRNKTIYAKRWNKSQGEWTVPRRVEPYRGAYRLYERDIYAQ